MVVGLAVSKSLTPPLELPENTGEEYLESTQGLSGQCNNCKLSAGNTSPLNSHSAVALSVLYFIWEFGIGYFYFYTNC